MNELDSQVSPDISASSATAAAEAPTIPPVMPNPEQAPSSYAPPAVPNVAAPAPAGNAPAFTAPQPQQPTYNSNPYQAANQPHYPAGQPNYTAPAQQNYTAPAQPNYNYGAQQQNQNYYQPNQSVQYQQNPNQPYQNYNSYQPYTPVKTNKRGLAITSLVMGSIADFFVLLMFGESDVMGLCLVCGILGLIFGIISLKSSLPNQKGMSIAGIITSSIALGLVVLLIIIGLIILFAAGSAAYHYFNFIPFLF